MNSLSSETGVLGDYRSLLNEFCLAGYKTADFLNFKPSQNLLLRHDIDFEPRCAVKTAEIERSMGLVASYFFMASSFSYNIFATESRKSIQKIAEMGHHIRLHFDPVPYGDDFLTGFQQERILFEQVLGYPVDIISIHRPNEFFLTSNQPLDGVPHTYLKKFVDEIAYCSDSQGQFRFGLPFDTDAFKRAETIQLLTHPVWWTIPAKQNVEALETFRQIRVAEFRQEMGKNCKPYAAWLNELPDDSAN